MLSSKKELFFVSVIITISSLCSFYTGNLFHLRDSVNPIKDIKIVRSENMLSSVPSLLNEKDFIFTSGYCYNIGSGFNHSDFYQGNISQINTSTYWRFPISEISALQYLKSTPKGWVSNLFIPYKLNLPIISILVHPDDFFSYSNGIYVRGFDADFVSSIVSYPTPWTQPANYYRKENDKRNVFFSYYNTKGEALYSSYAYAEISGKATRSFPQKSIRLSASKSLGNKNFKYDFFGNGDGLKSLVLRNGGNDNTKSLFRDMLMQELVKKTGILTSGFVPSEVFINGEYWGIHFLQNRVDENFIAESFGCKEKEVTIVENWKLDSGDESEFLNLIRVKDNLTKLNYAELLAVFDMDDLTTYLVGQLFFANLDWPANNLKMYKISNSKKSATKWRFAFFDLDFGFAYTGENAVSEDMFARLFDGKDEFSKLFRKLMESSDFHKLLREKFRKMISEDLSRENLKNKISSLENEISPAIQRHTERWRKPATVEEWNREVDILKAFATNRENEMNLLIKKYLK